MDSFIASIVVTLALAILVHVIGPSVMVTDPSRQVIKFCEVLAEILPCL